MILAAASPLLASCILEAGSMEEAACIILPDFTGQEVEEFLGLLYLADRQGQTPGPGPLFACLVEGAAALWSVAAGHAKVEAASVKAERKADKTAAEIKMEDIDLKLKKKSEEAANDRLSRIHAPASAHVAVVPMETTVVVSAQRKPESGQFKCAVCGKVFKLRRILTMHEAVHSEPRLACPEPGCSRRFRKRFNLKAHVDVVHRGAKHYPCELCGKLFYNVSKLKEHAATHTADKFICQHCPSIFAAAKSLRSHIRAQHSTDGRVPRCATCGKLFSTELNLKSHISRVHLKEKRCACPTCGKLFFENQQLSEQLWLISHFGNRAKLYYKMTEQICNRDLNFKFYGSIIQLQFEYRYLLVLHKIAHLQGHYL